jgi:hypothetical protein
MPATYSSIATTTLGSDQANITFSNITGVYTDLRLIAAIKTTTALGVTDLKVQVNADTGTNYSSTRIYGGSAPATSDRSSNQASWNQLAVSGANNSSNVFNPVLLDFMNYSNTVTNKTVLVRTNPLSSDAEGYVTAMVLLYRSTSAITSIKIESNSGANIASGSVVTLYGIKSF